MRITINLPKDLEQNLIQQATELNISLETLILQSLRQVIKSTSWSDLVLLYEGTPEFPSLEFYRAELLPTQEPELF